PSAPPALFTLSLHDALPIYRLLKRIPCFEQSGTSGGKQSQSTQIKFMRVRIVRTINDKWLAGAARELDAQFARDRLGNFILDLRSEEHTSELQSLAYLVCSL